MNKGFTLTELLMVIAIIVIIGAFTLNGVENVREEAAVKNTSVLNLKDGIYDFSKVITEGNRTYVPIENAWGNKIEEARSILAILAKFEAENPHLSIESWEIDRIPDSKGYIYGLWVDHQLRQKAEALSP